jgi:hypothetical protein
MIDLTYIGKGHLYSSNTPTINNSIEITRNWPSQKNQLSYLLHRSRFLFTYDNFTNLNVEAVICGAIPVFLLDKPYSDDDIDGGEFGYIPRIKFGEKITPSVFKKFHEERLDFLDRIQQILSQYEPSVNELVEKLEAKFGQIDRHNNVDLNCIASDWINSFPLN